MGCEVRSFHLGDLLYISLQRRIVESVVNMPLSGRAATVLRASSLSPVIRGFRLS